MGKVEEKEMMVDELFDIIGVICVEICRETDYDKELVCEVCSKVSTKLVGHLTGKRPINQSDITRTRLMREAVLSAVGIILKD